MKVVITAYRQAVTDADGEVIGIPGYPIAESGGRQKLTAAGSFAALPDETRFIRIATDTNIHIKPEGGSCDDTHEMVFANATEFLAAFEGNAPSIIIA